MDGRMEKRERRIVCWVQKRRKRTGQGRRSLRWTAEAALGGVGGGESQAKEGLIRAHAPRRSALPPHVATTTVSSLPPSLHVAHCCA
ncbi:hypothetical protein B296_00020596 [Ensete ventricosum]|uniref:Uncharacterized protein n=1 Tax=Ensete ventricosum TaxID=4639 RepID=A0A426Z8X5_ENSVE|nr:hypothetical protein B296_00020596 [Ensete ventricosum]